MQNNYYPMYQAAPQAVSQPAGSGIVWVQGPEGAKAYPVAAGNNVLLMDSEASVFYIKSTDQSGMPQPLRTFDYTERKAEQGPSTEYVTRKEFEEKLEALARKGRKKDE